MVRTALSNLKRQIFSLIGTLGSGVVKAPSQGFLAVEKRVLTGLEATKKRREECKRENDGEGLRMQTIIGERVDTAGARNGFVRRLSRGKEENGTELRMEEIC